MTDNGTATATRLRHGIAEELRVMLARKRLSATKLAAQLGWTQQYMSRRMVGDQAFDADDLEAIADALDIDVIDLLPSKRKRRYPEPLAVGASSIRVPRQRSPMATTYPSGGRPPGRPASHSPPSGPRKTYPTGR